MKKIFKSVKNIFSMATISINQQNFSGRNITVTNGKVIIDGVDVTPDSKNITISVLGDIDTLDVGACSSIEITGNANKVKTASGDVTIKGDVHGDVGSMSGDIKCGNISGNVKTMSGDINRR